VAPLLTPDYTPYIARIANVDCAVSGFAGSNPVRFMRSYADVGLAGKSRYSPGWAVIDDALLRDLGSEPLSRR
jgi:branched-chain amino acid transport system substrate-binding protein